MLLESPNQRLNNCCTATPREVKTGIGSEPLTKQCGHGCSIGIRHRHSTDQETQQIHPMSKEGILQVPIDQRTERAIEMAQSRKVWQQPAASAKQRPQTIQSARGKSQQRKRIRSRSDRLQNVCEASPLIRDCLTAEISDEPLKSSGADTDPKMAFRNKHIPVAIGDHLQRFIKRPENLGQRVAAGPATQAAPEGGT